MARRYFAARRDIKRDDGVDGRFAMRDAAGDGTAADRRRKNAANRFFDLRRRGLAAEAGWSGALRRVKLPGD
jgi:hypothetical protein